MAKRFSIHDWQAKINEQAYMGPMAKGFDDKFKDAMGGAGFSDEEQDDIMSRDVGSPFPGDAAFGLPGYEKARTLIDKLREDYKGMSDDDLDNFSKTMIEHFLDNTAAQAAAKVFFGKKQL
tara:strand:- start:3386 stop:3748 length:363 start_codon:yes stop_codon:yes gene_type:complete